MSAEREGLWREQSPSNAVVEICVICAWRATCQKKFSVSGKNIHCPDFVRDISLKKEAEKTGKKEEKEG